MGNARAHLVAELSAWCRAAIKRLDPVVSSRHFQLASVAKGILDAGRISELRQLKTELESFIEDAPAAVQRDIDADLRSSLGISLADSSARRRRRIERVVARGAVRNDDEYRLLDAYVGSLASLGKHAEADPLTILLAAYHAKRAGPKR
jgi:hypothetical protein